MRVRITLPPPASLKCRESTPSVAAKYAKHARIWQYFVHKPDCRERTGQQRSGSRAWLFSGRHMRSPVSIRPSGEWNAITCRGFRHSKLTFVSTLETEFSSSHNPVSGPRHDCFRWRALERGVPPHVYGGGVRKPAQNCSRVNPVNISLPDFHTWR